MNNFDTAKFLITNMAGKENTIAINTMYMKLMGGLEAGAFLSQVIYWSDKSGRKDGYFYKTYDEWKEELFISKYNVVKYSKKMVEMGFLETVNKKANGSPTVHYKFDLEAFMLTLSWFVKNLTLESKNFDDGKLNISLSLTEITTEITTEIKEIDNKGLSPAMKILQNANMIENEMVTRLVSFIETNNILIVRPIHREKLDELINDFGLAEELLQEAIYRSIGKSNILGYARAIVKRWHENGIKDLNELKTFEDNITKKQAPYKPYKQSKQFAEPEKSETLKKQDKEFNDYLGF